MNENLTYAAGLPELTSLRPVNDKQQSNLNGDYFYLFLKGAIGNPSFQCHSDDTSFGNRHLREKTEMKTQGLAESVQNTKNNDDNKDKVAQKPANRGDLSIAKEISEGSTQTGDFTGDSEMSLSNEEILELVRFLLNSCENGGSVTFKVHALTLGDIELNVRIAGKRISVRAAVEKEEAKAVLLSHAAELSAYLGEHGLILDKFEVETASKRSGEFDEQKRRRETPMENGFIDTNTESENESRAEKDLGNRVHVLA